jgi:atypical dual specificity phosphatase
VHDIDYDLKTLKRVGVTVLLSLTERPPDVAEMEAHGLKNIWSPVPDMEAPSPNQANDICRKIDLALSEGEVVAVHCRAGLGRTGTILAAYLIWEGNSAFDALEEVRRIEPRWVQSDVQVKFLERFSAVIKGRMGKETAAPE